MKKVSVVLVVSLLVSMVTHGADYWYSPNPTCIRPISGINYVGIGTNNPATPLHVEGTVLMTGFRLTTGAGSGKVLISDGSGVGTWQSQWLKSGSNLYYTGNVGIGTTSPLCKFHVQCIDEGPCVPEERSAIYGYNSSNGTYHNPVGLYGKVNASSGVAVYGTNLNSSGYAGYFEGRGYFSGKVGIGTYNPGDYELAVNGEIRAKEIKVETDWSDFVFADNYKLMPLNKLEKYIKTNKSLPGIPKEKEVVQEGVNLGEMQSKLLAKVEELTLYVIELKKENEALKNRISTLEK
jgi:hypothetical protein